MASAKKSNAGSKGSKAVAKEFTSPTKKSQRRREKVLGMPKQSATKIKKRQAGERGAMKRITADTKRLGKLDAAGKAGKMGRREYGTKRRALLKSMAKRARLSKSAGSGAG